MSAFAHESMSAQLEITFLGTGTSVGIPIIGCSCEVCTSTNPKNNRLRSSIHLQYGELSLLVDSGPDLRQQALRERLKKVDAVIYTHEHLDHVSGFDELRAFCWFREDPLPMHATPGCMETLMRMYPWAFSVENTHRGYVKPAPHIIDGPFQLGGLMITPVPVVHGVVDTVGLIFQTPEGKRFGYVPDAKSVPDSSIELLYGVDWLVIDALSPRPHPTHLSVDEALEVIGKTQAKQAFLTHLGHDCEHEALGNSLPEHVRVAHDGLKLII
jgi:phosphoribosyl 1,2-cyclic phosphate phosphodiesterase